MSLDNTKSKLPLNKDKFLNTVTIGLFALGLLCVGYVLISNYLKKKETREVGNLDCVQETRQIQVLDDHMAGVFTKDQMAPAMTNFYNCNNVQRGEYVLFQFSEQIPPVIRVVRGIPGDRYNLTEDTEKKGRWNIAINGEAVKTLDGGNYFIDSNTVPPLKTYELSRGGVLGPDEHILLSLTPPGLSDSSNLGLVKKKNLVGKVVQK